MNVQLETDIQVFMKEYFDDWTGGDIEDILSYFSDDVVINLLGGPALLEGKAAVKENFVIPFTTAFPGNHHLVQNLVHSGKYVVIEWLFTAIHKGNYGSLPPSGREVNLPGCSVYTVEDGRITRGNLYFNGPTLLEQLGATG